VDSNAVYWAALDSVMKVGLSGGTPVALASNQVTGGIAVDSNAIYWATTDSVMKVGLSGGTPVTVADLQGNGINARGIAVGTNAIYWINSFLESGYPDQKCSGGTVKKLAK
jgi:hypothetical protein